MLIFHKKNLQNKAYNLFCTAVFGLTCLQQFMVIFMFFMKNKTEIYIYIGYKLGYDCISQKCLQLYRHKECQKIGLLFYESL